MQHILSTYLLRDVLYLLDTYKTRHRMANILIYKIILIIMACNLSIIFLIRYVPVGLINRTNRKTDKTHITINEWSARKHGCFSAFLGD